jgi:hypothetical protein
MEVGPVPIEYSHGSPGDTSRVIMYECPACGRELEENSGKMFCTHLAEDHSEDDFGDVESYKQDNSRHVLFDEPEIDEPMAGVSA